MLCGIDFEYNLSQYADNMQKDFGRRGKFSILFEKYQREFIDNFRQST